MIIDCVDIKVVPNNFEDDGLLQYPKETRNKIITEILFSLQANPNFFMEQSRILTPFRDRFNFTLSIIGACLHDGISTASERRVMACVEIYEKWLTQSPRPSFLTAEFLITMTNQLSMPFARATDIYDQNTRCSILNRISLLLRKITTTEYKTKSLQEDSEMFLYHMFKLHMMIIHAIVRMTYPVDHQCLKILSETFLTVMVSCKQTEEYQRTLGLFTRIAGKWIALSEFRTAFLAYHTKLQNEYLKVYKKFDKIPFIVPFSDDCSMGGLMLDEKHVRRLWVMNLQLFDVTNLEVDGLLELVKVFGENMAQALEREMSSRLIYKLYINTFFNIIKLYNHKKHQDSINFTIINVTNYFEKRSGEIAGDDFLLSRMILFFKHCFKSECVDILVCTMGSLDRLLQTHITELILVYKELVYTMFQLTSVFDTAKDKIPLMVIISTMNSLRYYFPILFACFGRVEKLFNLEELLYLHLAIFTTIEQLGFFGKNNCAIYFETVADFIGVFGKTWPDPTLLESYLISFEGTVKKSAKWMFQKYNSEEFVGLYRVFEEFYQILHRFSHPEKHIKSIVETLIKIIKGMIRCSSSEVIHCFIEKLVEFSVFDKNITDELFPEIIDLLMYLSNNDTALVKNNLKFITSFYYFFFSHPQKGMYYNLLDEKDMLLASKTNTDIQFNDKYNGLNKLSGNEFEANELNKTTVWREKDRVVSMTQSNPKELVVISRNENGKDVYFFESKNRATHITDLEFSVPQITYLQNTVKDPQSVTTFITQNEQNETAENTNLLQLNMTQRITELHTKLLEKQKNTKDLNYKNDWKTTLFSSQFLKAPQLFVMKDSSFINTLSQNVASKVKRRIYIRVVEDELNESNLRGDGVYEKTLNVVFKKEGNAFVGRHRRDVCEFVYYTGEPKPESQGVIFIECDLPKEKQKEEYIAVIKSVDWETRKIQIISNNKKEHENFRRYNAVRSVVESEMIRLMARNAPGVFLSLKSDDVLMNEKIDNEISENWSEQIVMGKCFDREFMVKMDTLCKDKTYVGYQEEYERMVERENKKSKEKMDNPDVIVKLLENESNDQNDTAQKVEKIEQKSEKTESGENEEQNEENAEGFNAFLDLTQFI